MHTETAISSHTAAPRSRVARVLPAASAAHR